jgi:hypothetical protein
VASDQEIRDRIEREFRLQLNAVRALDALSDRFLAAMSTGRGMRHKADSIIAFSAARETTTIKATLLLVESGFGRQAKMLNRSTFEGLAVACWVAANPDEAVDRFDKSNEFEIHLMREKVVASHPDADISEDGRLDPGRVEECVSLFGKNNQRLWTGHSDLWALIKAIENRWDEAERKALKMYVGYEHERNNKELHPSASALFAAVSNPASRQDGRPGMSLRIGPGSAELDAAFLGLFFIQQNLLRFIAEEFDLGLDALSELGDLVAEHQFAFAGAHNEMDSGLGRNDPCWCGSGKKFKKCHGS